MRYVDIFYLPKKSNHISVVLTLLRERFIKIVSAKVWISPNWIRVGDILKISITLSELRHCQNIYTGPPLFYSLMLESPPARDNKNTSHDDPSFSACLTNRVSVCIAGAVLEENTAPLSSLLLTSLYEAEKV